MLARAGFVCSQTPRVKVFSMFSRVSGEFGAGELNVEKGSTKTLLTSEGYGFSP